MKKTTILLACWLVGCGAASATGQNVGCGWTPDPEIHGAHLDTDDCHTEWCFEPNLKERVRKTIEAGADYWGTDYDVLYGWKIRVIEGDSHCTGAGSGNVGCADWLHMTITITTMPSGIEWTALVHEIGHLALAGGDPGHWDARWWDDEAFASVFYNLVGSSCRVWRIVTNRCPDVNNPIPSCYELCPCPYLDFYAP